MVKLVVSVQEGVRPVSVEEIKMNYAGLCEPKLDK